MTEDRRVGAMVQLESDTRRVVATSTWMMPRPALSEAIELASRCRVVASRAAIFGASSLRGWPIACIARGMLIVARASHALLPSIVGASP